MFRSTADPLARFGFDGAIEEVRVPSAPAKAVRPRPGNFSSIPEDDEEGEDRDVIPNTLSGVRHAEFSAPRSNQMDVSFGWESSSNFHHQTPVTEHVTVRRGKSPGIFSNSVWVTFFGFPPSQTNSVKAHIERLLGGSEIVELRQANGNYIHARFRSVGEAKNSLQLSGHVVDDGLMIGAVPCVSPLVEEPKIPSAPVNKTVTVPPPLISGITWLQPFTKFMDWIFEW